MTTRRILPIYPLTAGLTNAALLRLVQQALAVCDPPEEILPAGVREKYGILPAERAYFAIHEQMCIRDRTCFVISFLINHKTGSAIRRCLPD